MSRGFICELLSSFSRVRKNFNFAVRVCLVLACCQEWHSHIENRSTARQFILAVRFWQRRVEDSGLLGRDAASLDKQFPTFRRKLLPSWPRIQVSWTLKHPKIPESSMKFMFA